MSCYFELINYLRSKLKGKIAYSRVYKLLNLSECEFDKIEELLNSSKIEINEDDLMDIIFTIYLILDEMNKIAIRMEARLNNFPWLNETLGHFNIDPQPSITQAKKKLKEININIYDLDDGRYDKQTDYKLLRSQLRRFPEWRFPLELAKNTPTFKLFLKKI